MSNPTQAPTFEWTSHQNAIFEALTTDLTGSYILQACAGASKTTTLEEAVRRLVNDTGVPPGYILALAFNKKIAEALAARMPHGVTCSTMNALGHRALTRFLPHSRLAVSAWKEQNLWRDFVPAYSGLEKQEQKNIADAYLRAKMGGCVAAALDFELVPDTISQPHTEKFFETLRPTAPHDFVAAFADNLGDASMELDPRDWTDLARQVYTLDLGMTYCLGSISFLDQLYLTAICPSVSLTQFRHVLIDEAQDLGNLEHAILRKVVSKFPAGRLIGVGDPAQAIYAFKGAHYDSMERLGKLFKASTLSLPVSFRCPKAVVAEAKRLNPQIEPWSQAAEGEVAHLTEWDYSSLPRPSTILCRMNYPLVQTGLALIQAGIGAKFLARNFEEELLNFFATWRKKSKILPGMYLAIEQEIKAQESKDKHKANRLSDYLACLKAIGDQYSATTFEELEGGIRILFNSPGPITLATIHKAKGLEWPRVYLIRPDLCPHPNATSEEDLQQEYNMLYVAVTRAQEYFGYLYKKES